MRLDTDKSVLGLYPELTGQVSEDLANYAVGIYIYMCVCVYIHILVIARKIDRYFSVYLQCKDSW